MSRFVYYNNNPYGIRTEDCVTRAITLVSELPYELVSEKLWLTADLYDCDRLCKFCYSNFINNVLKYKEVNCDKLTVGEFADENPYGCYLIRVEGHLTACIRGEIFDIWDCRDRLCDTVWQKT